jgi:hypothetical protein
MTGLYDLGTRCCHTGHRALYVSFPTRYESSAVSLPGGYAPMPTNSSQTPYARQLWSGSTRQPVFFRYPATSVTTAPRANGITDRESAIIFGWFFVEQIDDVMLRGRARVLSLDGTPVRRR